MSDKKATHSTEETAKEQEYVLPTQPGGPFQPDPLHTYGRLDTRGDVNPGEQLAAISPQIYTEQEVLAANAALHPDPYDPAAADREIDPTASSGVEGEVTNSKPESGQITVGGQHVEPVTGSGPSGAPLTEQPEVGSGEISDADEAAALGTTVEAVADAKDTDAKGSNAKAATSSRAKADGYDEMNVDELKDELRDRELTVGGNKDELIARLREADKAKKK